MWEGPIVAEIREIREKLAARFNFNVKAIFADFRMRQGLLGGRPIPQNRAEPMVEAVLGRHCGTAEFASCEAALAA